MLCVYVVFFLCLLLVIDYCVLDILHIYVEGKFRWKCINPFWQVAKLILSMGMLLAVCDYTSDLSNSLTYHRDFLSLLFFFSFLFQSNKAIHFELICRVLTVDLTNKSQTLIVKWLVLFRQFTGDE